jgi:methionyl-tRNA formyltransferase
LLDDALDELALFEADDGDGPDLDVSRHARQVGASHAVLTDIRSEEGAAAISAFSPDLLLVATFPAKLPDSLLCMQPLGCVNVHPSLLPRYRGAHPEFWVIRNGESESGVSLHRMTSKLDAGDLISQQRILLGRDETLGSLSNKLAHEATALVRTFLDQCRRGVPFSTAPQDETLATDAPKVRPTHLRIRWEDRAIEIERLVRACHPFLEARATLDGREVVVRKCRLGHGCSSLAPGELRLGAGCDSVEVGAGDGSLVLDQVEAG